MFGRFLVRDGRELLWALLDVLDARPALKRALLLGVPTVAIALGFGIWGYRQWAQSNSIRIARQWLAANRLDRAGVAVEDALATRPGLPDPWSLASELAWRKGNRPASVEYARRAADVSRFQAEYVLAWGEAAILSGDPEQARDAAAHLDPAFARASPRALRLEGEIARRNRRFEEARARFQAALEVDAGSGARPLAIDEVPLGIVCLQTASEDDRSRGKALLSRWAPDPEWGAEALRALLADALAHRDMGATARLAEELRAHPRCTLGDLPTCLRALAASDPPRYSAVLASLEDQSRRNANSAAQMLGWLTQIGQAAEAVRWGESLDPATATKPPVAQGVAEALRASGRWSDLRVWVERVDWGADLGFVGLAYGMTAAEHAGDAARAESFWKGLSADGSRSAAHALFAGDLLYSWGYPKEAEALLWAAADRPDLAFEALGTLARLYQVRRDADGQYRAFSRLNAMRPADRRIANNFAYFAAVTGRGSRDKIEQIAKENYTSDPDNVVYRSTYAFVLVWAGQEARAMNLIEPVKGEWRASPAVAFAYGAALASQGRKAEAREVFGSLDPHMLGERETSWINAAVR